MTDEGSRYDRIAEGYARWWAPVLAPSAVAVLDRLDREIDGQDARVLDVGTGTGTLLVAALDRWPRATIDAIDASVEMAAAARTAVLTHPGAPRCTVTTALADRLPFRDDTFDAAMSSFVLQLVPNRARALREIRRVLRPGGRLVYVTWMVDRRRWRPDEVLDDVLDDLGIGAREEEDEPAEDLAGDLPSAAAAVGGLRAAGFRQVTAETATLRHRFDPDSYTAFIAEFDEETLVSSLEPELRERFTDELRRRLARLRPRQLELDAPIVYATGRKPGP